MKIINECWATWALLGSLEWDTKICLPGGQARQWILCSYWKTGWRCWHDGTASQKSYQTRHRCFANLWCRDIILIWNQRWCRHWICDLPALNSKYCQKNRKKHVGWYQWLLNLFSDYGPISCHIWTISRCICIHNHWYGSVIVDFYWHYNFNFPNNARIAEDDRCNRRPHQASIQVVACMTREPHFEPHKLEHDTMMIVTRMYLRLFVFFTRWHTLHLLVYISLHFHQWACSPAHTLIVLCMIPSRFGY